MNKEKLAKRPAASMAVDIAHTSPLLARKPFT